MISDDTLRLVQNNIMEAITAVYVEDKDDDIAKEIAGYLIIMHEAIDIEILERMMSR